MPKRLTTPILALLLALCLTVFPQASVLRGFGEPQPEPEPGQAPAQTQPVFTQAPLSREVIARVTGGSHNASSPVTLDQLRYLRITYLDLSGNVQTGEMIVHQDLAAEVLDIFRELYEARFPIAQMVLIDDYGADDAKSMAANNTSAYCSRLIAGTSRPSVHSYGAAVDLNPVQNPYVTASGVQPPAASAYLDRTHVRPGMIVPGDVCYNAFTSRGWTWGGHWANPDYQHFEKNVTP